MPLTATNAKSVVYARYYTAIRGKIEEYGTAFFPKDANNQPIYGDLILIIRVNKTGNIGYNKDGYNAAPVEIARSSGNPLLDLKALEIVQKSMPFGQFPVEMSKSIDILEVISTFRFNKQGFETSLQGN
jgi:protein TonB